MDLLSGYYVTSRTPFGKHYQHKFNIYCYNSDMYVGPRKSKIELTIIKFIAAFDAQKGHNIDSLDACTNDKYHK